MQFTELVESLLSTQLAEIGLDPEDFAAIVKRAGTSSPMFQILTTHLLALDDFQTFKRMINKSTGNLELELQAIQSLQRGAGAQRPTPRVGGGASPSRLPGHSSVRSGPSEAEED
jgi:hypothetical protein